jgi:hypothetical protein
LLLWYYYSSCCFLFVRHYCFFCCSLFNATILFVVPCLFNVASLYLFKVIAPYLFNAIVLLVTLCLFNVDVVLVAPCLTLLFFLLLLLMFFAQCYCSYCCFLLNDATPFVASCSMLLFLLQHLKWKFKMVKFTTIGMWKLALKTN